MTHANANDEFLDSPSMQGEEVSPSGNAKAYKKGVGENVPHHVSGDILLQQPGCPINEDALYMHEEKPLSIGDTVVTGDKQSMSKQKVEAVKQYVDNLTDKSDPCHPSNFVDETPSGPSRRSR